MAAVFLSFASWGLSLPLASTVRWGRVFWGSKYLADGALQSFRPEKLTKIRVDRLFDIGMADAHRVRDEDD